MSLIARSDIIRALSPDAQAQLTTDPNRPVRLGAGDGSKVTWDTPFLEASSVKGYVNGTLVPGTTMGMADGTDGVDTITFPSAPALGAIVSVSADLVAINVNVLDAVVASAEGIEAGKVALGGFAWPVTGDSIAVETPYIVALVEALLRHRRDPSKDLVFPQFVTDHWKELAQIKGLAVSAVPVSTASSDATLYGSEERVFIEDPASVTVDTVP